MMFGGVPIGVARPPMEAANEVISIRPVAYRRWIGLPPACSLSNRKARIARPMANIIAVVAVLEIQAEMKAVTAPKANRMRPGRAPTGSIASLARLMSRPPMEGQGPSIAATLARRRLPRNGSRAGGGVREGDAASGHSAPASPTVTNLKSRF